MSVANLKGLDLLRNHRYNKGTAFTPDERNALGLQGLLPPGVQSMDEQVAQCLQSIHDLAEPLSKYKYMANLADTNEALFFRILTAYPAECMPIVYTPTVGLACQQFGRIFERPRGVYITLADRGNIKHILQRWPEKNVRAMVMTDGERILGLGDLGANGMGIPIGKLQLYTACGGVPPSWCLPVTFDTGTNNKAYLEDPFYKGTRALRNEESWQPYDELIDEFMSSAVDVFGPTVLLQFEDFANRNAFRLLEKYRNRYCSFNDDIQGTAGVALAGMYAASRAIGTPLADMKFLIFGAGSAGIGIAELIALAIFTERNRAGGEDKVHTLEEARKNIYLYDSKGLVTQSRQDLSALKLLFAHDTEPAQELAAAVKLVQPHVLLGVSAQPQTFTVDVIKAMTVHPRPVIFALSNPTSKAECTAEQAYTWTDGTCFFASGSPFDPVLLNGKLHVPGQGNNSYIFPGLAMGVLASGARHVPEEMFLAAARELATQLSEADIAQGTLYPPLDSIRAVSDHIAAKVAEVAFDMGLATVPEVPGKDYLALVQSQTYKTGSY